MNDDRSPETNQSPEKGVSISRREAIAGIATLGGLAAALFGSLIYRMADSRIGANRSAKPAPKATVRLPESSTDQTEPSKVADSNGLEGSRQIPHVSDEELFKQDAAVQRATHAAPLPKPTR